MFFEQALVALKHLPTQQDTLEQAIDVSSICAMRWRCSTNIVKLPTAFGRLKLWQRP